MRLSAIAGAAVLTALCISDARPVEGAQTPTGIVINSIDLVNNTVSGTVAGVPFTDVPITWTLKPAPGNGQPCAILDLMLGPIDVDLAGLFVDTSPICLTITAFPGQGLLGNLLCGLSDGGLNLQDILGSLEGLLVEVLNDALGQSNGGGNSGGNGGGQGGDTVCRGECEILDIVLGPLTLNLLGVRVHLFNCDHGPIEVCISSSATGGALGQLLCGLVDKGSLLGLTLEELTNVLALAVSTLP